MKSACVFLVVASTIAVRGVADTTWTNENIGEYNLTRPGKYSIEGTVTGNINVELDTPGDVVIEGAQGTSPTLQGIPRPGERRHVSHIKGSVSTTSSLTIRNLTIRGDGHNAIECAGEGRRLFENLHIVNYERVENGKTYEQVGSVNAGQNSVIRSCLIETGDDALKLTEPNSRAYNCRVRAQKNGSAIQFGWGNRCDGPNHVADNIQIHGRIAPNAAGHTNDDDNSGRCVIGGIIQNDTSNIRLTGLDIDVDSYKHLIKLIVDGATLEGVIIQGTVAKGGVFNCPENPSLKAIALVARNGGKIRNCVIDLGEAAAREEYHYIKGDVDVTFVSASRNGQQPAGENQTSRTARDRKVTEK